MNSLTLVDTHVHLYKSFNLESFLKKVHGNFLNARTGLNDRGTQINTIILTEGGMEPGIKKVFQSFDNSDQLNTIGKTENYQLVNSDSLSFAVIQIKESFLLILSGRQLISMDNIEVLALGTTTQFNTAKNTEQIIEEVSHDGSLPVLPWGVGKWLGRRGKIVANILQNQNLPRFFIGDSANRPVFWSEPSQFGLARANGIKNLPGSDPLPVKNGYKNAGKAGIVLKDSINLDDPVHSIKNRLLDPSTDIQPYIKRENPISFFRNQFAMQYKKYFGYDNKQKS